MLHVNADFYSMTNHRNAEDAHVSVPTSTQQFGIEKTGKVSALGRAEARASLAVGEREFRDVALSVFETSQDPPMNGMLGVQWIREANCVVDYDRKVVLLPETREDTAGMAADLRARGYVPHAMTWDQTGKRYFIRGTVEGVAVDMNVSTVAGDVLDIAFAQAAKIKLSGKVGQAGGPTGTLEDQFATLHPVSIVIGDQQTRPSRPLVWNIAGYDRSAKAAQKATLGADFMLANHAVIDFGTGTLYLRR